MSEKEGFFLKLKNGLKKTRDQISESMTAVFTASTIDDDFFDELEEILILSDVGVNATTDIMDSVRAKIKENHLKTPEQVKSLLAKEIAQGMKFEGDLYPFETQKSIVLVVGVNGVGKTTTIGKIASMLKAMNRKVILAGADTFRAAAMDQLKVWSERVGCDFVGGNEGQDPASVVFDALNAMKARNADVLLVDTAGRLHNKKNLMEELKKIKRVIDREANGIYMETLIVLDGATGQNALMQAKEFKEAADMDGIVITKLDGTPKGGIAIAVSKELEVPVKYIGVGEQIDDLQKFDADLFTEALFDLKEEGAADEE